MTTYRFEPIRVGRTHRGNCPTCGKRTTRSCTFEHTVNPWNKNPDGTVRTRREVYEAVCVEADAWVPDFEHAACAERREAGAT